MKCQAWQIKGPAPEAPGDLRAHSSTGAEAAAGATVRNWNGNVNFQKLSLNEELGGNKKCISQKVPDFEDSE